MVSNRTIAPIDSNYTLVALRNVFFTLNASILDLRANYQRKSSGAVANNHSADDRDVLYPIEWVIPVTVVYGIIFLLGLVGNVSTCVVIARNKSLHTVTNYYLFSIAISDLLLLISGLPPEMYRIWSPETYVFGEAFCILQGFAAETSANATVLAITAFTVERYLAICHPFLSHTMSNLSRAIRFIFTIWICALCLAAPQAIQFGVEYETKNGIESSQCTVVAQVNYLQHAFEISTFVIFVGPMTLISVLYVLIAINLGQSRKLSSIKRESKSRASRKAVAQNRVIKMLVAVVVAFFICWAPFHAQRLLAVYLSGASLEAQQMCIDIYIALTYISGVLYFLSTTVNPILYHIMSNKFRQAFKNTFYAIWYRKDVEKRRHRTYSTLSRCQPSLRHYSRADGVHSFKQVVHVATTTDERSRCMVELTEQGNPLDVAASRRQRHHSQCSNTTTLTTISNSLPMGCKPQLVRERRKKTQFFRFFWLFHKSSAPIGGRLSEEKQESQNAQPPPMMDDISNSSLQDIGDELEYSSSDIVKYMQEVNVNLNSQT